MEVNNNTKITIETIINENVEVIWKYWTEPKHIMKWNNASDEWHTTFSENDLKVGGKFLSRMEAKDGSAGFDFWGIYDDIKLYEYISYTLGDKRKVSIKFIRHGDKTAILEVFEAENVYPIEYQQKGWQAILDNFKKYVEEKLYGKD